MNTSTAPLKGTPWPSSVVIRAQQHKKAGWSLREICNIIERETGRRPSPYSVLRWVDPEQHAKHLNECKRRRRVISLDGAENGGRLGQGHHTKAYQQGRARALVSEAGLTVGSAAKAMSFDYPTEGWSEYRVRLAVSR